jgi:8-oxo-dGTP pyrophosphatase MutT (NUDIX family)
VVDGLDDLRERFAGHIPKLSAKQAGNQASIALILCEGERDGRSDLSILFIRRAESEADRWSGHIAFPGGRVDPNDSSPSRTAERETLEEVGIAIDQSNWVARLDDLEGSSESIVVSGFVYALDSPPTLTLNHEIAEAFWLPIHEIEDPNRHEERTFQYLEHELPLPALRVLDDDRHPLLWGLSYRFLQILMEKLDRHLPEMPWHEDL